MKPGIRKAVNLTAFTLLFFIVGVVLYGSLYGMVINMLKHFSKGGVEFKGEFPMLFIHSLLFGLIFCVIPGCVFICHQILRGKSVKDYMWTCILYFVFFVTAFWGVTDFESFFIVASTDPNKRNAILSHNVQDVHLNGIFILAIILATIFTTFANMIKWLRAPKPKPKAKTQVRKVVKKPASTF
ncbi:hypothetical protein HNQ91_005796 [Filimonas zeae]|nr:hypothetical protein [Filimonas zeae]MDR6342711.1 hypothetical protein [Filimonas zeae]